MARKSLGYVKTEWVCPNCGTRNPGPKKTCVNCGAPQPENVTFSLPTEQGFVTDEKERQAAAAGADIHCAFCGARNPATAKTCSQCGADLSEGKKRQAGREMARPSGPKTVVCTNCGTENPASAVNCAKCGAPLPRAVAPQAQPESPIAPTATSGVAPARSAKKPNWLLLGGVAGALLLCCIAIFALFFAPTSSVQATVTDIYWQTSMPVQEMQAVQYTNESGNPPADAYNVSCQTETHEVCEQKTIDQGNGFAEVVEECHTESEQYCDYTLDEWSTIQTYSLDGNDSSPVYAQPEITGGQRYGDESASYTVTFDTQKGVMTYTPGSLDEFQQFQPGSAWKLKLNAIGGIVGVER